MFVRLSLKKILANLETLVLLRFYIADNQIFYPIIGTV